MSDHEPNGDPIPGWPGSTEPSPEAPPSWTPPGPGAGAPPPAAPPPGGYAPPPSYPPAWGSTPPPGPPPAGYGPPSAPPAGYGYGYSGYSGYPMAQDHPQGTTILVLGILSLVVCGLLGPVAWYMGNKAIKEIDANPAAYANRGNVQAGRIIGIIASCILIFVVAVYGFLIIAVAVGSATS